MPTEGTNISAVGLDYGTHIALFTIRWLGSITVWCWTYNQEVVGSTSGWVTVKRLGQVTVQTGKPSRYITNTKVNLAFYPYGVGKSSISLSGWG